jgi:prepilin-type N-terminal cleavage/methylation domain-containing protein
MNKNGFSLIELIMVLTLAVVLAAVVTPIIFRAGQGLSAFAAAKKIREDIIYAQSLAMQGHKLSTPASNVTNLVFRYRVRFNFNDGANCPGTKNYSIVNDSDFDGNWGENSGESARNPSTGGDFFCVQLDAGDYAGITASADFGGSTPGIVEFDAFGTPYDNDGAKLSGVKTVSISKSGETAQITVTPYTGRVTVQ